jgi:hypothetical protein
VSVACYAAGGDLLDGGVDGVEEGFGFGGAGHGEMGCAGFEVLMGSWYYGLIGEVVVIMVYYC